MAFKGIHLYGVSMLAAYGLLLGVSSFAEDPSKVGNAEKSPAVQAPAPGSEGDTLTREDARMALLIYKLLDKDGNLKGANPERGKELFYENCRQCHGTDGRRMNFGDLYTEIYMGQRAREDLPTFWYQINFGDEERGMEAYIDEFTVEEMVDIAGHARTLP